MGVLNAFDASVDAAVKNGALDTVENGAVIEAARKVAAIFDQPEWPMVNGKLDNVSPSVFLKYCDALGLTPDASVITEKPQASRLTMMVSSSKFSKAAND